MFLLLFSYHIYIVDGTIHSVMACFFVPGSDDFLKIILSSISLTPHSWRAIRLSALLATFFCEGVVPVCQRGREPHQQREAA